MRYTMYIWIGYIHACMYTCIVAYIRTLHNNVGPIYTSIYMHTYKHALIHEYINTCTYLIYMHILTHLHSSGNLHVGPMCCSHGRLHVASMLLFTINRL